MAGITFHEVMSGPFTLGVRTPEDGARGEATLTLRADLDVADLDTFIADTNHAGRLTGSVEFDGWTESGTGTFQLFRPSDAPATQVMAYRLGFQHGGKRFYLNGVKHVRNDLGPDLWRDTTTLETTLHEGADATGPVVGAGVLRLGPGELFDLLRTLRATGAASRAEEVVTVTRFYRFFVGRVFAGYVAGAGGTPKQPMVGWYAPTLFLRAGVEVVISAMFSRYADQRLVQAVTGRAAVFDYTHLDRRDYLVDVQPPPPALAARTELWLDYVADTGDGWDSTYAVAHLAAQPELVLEAPDKSKTVTRQGDVLVFGGDQVYPTASPRDYQLRLVAPYRAAYGDRPQPDYPNVFAIPGNHDWYDGLVSFSRLFCSNEPFAGPDHRLAQAVGQGCETPQRRSYFALKLPHGWWLLGTDVQLHTDIDGPQLDYFRAVVKRMAPADRVILCVAEPYWLHPKRAEKGVGAVGTEKTALDVLEHDVLGSRVSVFLAGDVHHYKRYATDDDKLQKITAGGGGAFLHPTHGPWKNEIDGKARHRASFPPKSTSWFLGLKNLLFLFLNPKFGFLTGALYVVMAMLILPGVYRLQDIEYPETDPAVQELRAELAMDLALAGRDPAVLNVTDPDRPRSFRERVAPADEGSSATTPRPDEPVRGMAGDFFKLPVHQVIWKVFHNEAKIWAPFEALLFSLFLVVYLGGFYFFTDIPNRFLRTVFGVSHGLVHYLAAFVLVVVAMKTAKTWLPENDDFPVNLLILAVAFASGYVLGPVVMGLYLLGSLNVFSRHWNEAFSSLRISDWKNFLRLHIGPTGDLTIYPVGLRKVPTRWKEDPAGHGSRVVPDGVAIEPELIEAPIVVTRNGGADGR